MTKVLSFLMILMIIAGCKDEPVLLPKPRMYPRITWPKNSQIIDFVNSECNFTFRYPVYTEVAKDTFIFEGAPLHPCWFDLKTNDLNASIHCSYYQISKVANLSKLINDAFYIASKHNIKANYRKETVIENDYGVKGILFEIEGPVASPLQFYLTDEKNHFFRGSLYLNSKVNPDSTAVVVKFLRQNIDTMINTFHWK